MDLSFHDAIICHPLCSCRVVKLSSMWGLMCLLSCCVLLVCALLCLSSCCVSSMCGLVCLSSCCVSSMFGLVCLSSCCVLSVCGVVRLSSHHSIIIVWLSWCYCESSVPCLGHQKVSQKDRQWFLYQKNRPPVAYIIIKSITER